MGWLFLFMKGGEKMVSIRIMGNSDEVKKVVSIFTSFPIFKNTNISKEQNNPRKCGRTNEDIRVYIDTELEEGEENSQENCREAIIYMDYGKKEAYCCFYFFYFS